MKTIGTPELQSMINRGKKFALINTLSPEKFRVTRIPSSENVPLADEEFVEKVEQCTGSKANAVVVYCADSECNSSSKAAARLEEAGFTSVYEYTGGAKAWQAAGGILAPRTAETA
jgi:rhodanese-related sulfurtransferase